MLRLLHTSDWHLGHTLHDVPRDAEHAQFLSWLLAMLEAERVDALLVAGDIFDTANPSAEAQRTWYGFVAEARCRLPRLQVVVVAGNHDSPARLDAPGALFRALGVHVVGALPRERGQLVPERLLFPLHDGTGREAAWVAAVPFLRQAELPSVGEDAAGVDPLVEGVRRVYAGVFEAARAQRQPGQALVAMGHGYLTGTRLSELSERKVLGGNLHALPADIFPADVAYTALGHLHLAQKVGGREGVRYSGSPLPLALDEAGYRHQVLVVELEGPALAAVRPLAVPRAVDILRVPETGSAPLAEVLALLRRLPARAAGGEQTRPFLEVYVSLATPEPELRRKVEEALEGKAARLVKLAAQAQGDMRVLADAVPGEDLRSLSPEVVFRRRYQREHPGEPEPPLLAAFHELLEKVQQDDGA